MKKSQLKPLIEKIIKETIIRKLMGEGQPIGGVKNDHPFDAGRNNVMKAVNVAENDTPMMNTLEVYRETGVKCGKAQRKKDQGTVSHLMDWFHKAVRMEPELSRKLAIDSFNKGYREGTGYSKQQKPTYFREKVGFDGKYVDDMESGVAVKKLHNLDENPIEYKQKFVYPENFKKAKNYIRVTKIQSTNEFAVYWFTNGKKDEKKCYYTNDSADAWNTFAVMKMSVDLANSNIKKNMSEYGRPTDKKFYMVTKKYNMVGSQKNNNLKHLLDIAKSRKYDEFAIYRDEQGFHSTAQLEYLVCWYQRDGGYYTNMANKNPDLFKKMIHVDDNGNFTIGNISGIKENEESLSGKFVNRGQIKLEGGLDYETAYKIAKYHWDIFGQSGKDERGVWNFQTRGDRWCCSVGMLNGQPAMLSITTTPGRLQLLVGDELMLKKIDEMTGTGAVAGYSTPYAFSKKKSGSKRALDATTKMGYKKVKDID